jgi:hypothetical protein
MTDKSIKSIGFLGTLVLLLGANFTPKNYREVLLSLRGDPYAEARSHRGICGSGLTAERVTYKPPTTLHNGVATGTRPAHRR